jgi:hypothetical protein
MVVLALATAAVGQSAPAGPREPTWGATPEAVIRAYPNAQCAAERAELSDWWCILSDTTVDAVSVDVVLYGYTTGTVLGMVGVALGFDSGDVHRILEILVARYGRWSRVVEREFVTKADTRFRSAIWLWYLPDVEIRVEQDRGTLGHGQATVMLRAGLAELQARERGSKMRDGGEAVEAPR